MLVIVNTRILIYFCWVFQKYFSVFWSSTNEVPFSSIILNSSHKTHRKWKVRNRKCSYSGQTWEGCRWCRWVWCWRWWCLPAPLAGRPCPWPGWPPSSFLWFPGPCRPGTPGPRLRRGRGRSNGQWKVGSRDTKMDNKIFMFLYCNEINIRWHYLNDKCAT